MERLPDGLLHVAVLTRMPNVSPEMIGWWFGEYMQTTEHYKRWHPRDHVWMSWTNKQPGTHVGASHLVHEYTGAFQNTTSCSVMAKECMYPVSGSISKGSPTSPELRSFPP